MRYILDLYQTKKISNPIRSFNFSCFSSSFQCKKSYDIKRHCLKCARICFSDYSLEFRANRLFYEIYPFKLSSLSILYLFEEGNEKSFKLDIYFKRNHYIETYNDNYSWFFFQSCCKLNQILVYFLVKLILILI